MPTQTAFVFCSISQSDAHILDMIENSLEEHGFIPITIGRNQDTEIDTEYLEDTLREARLVMFVLTSDSRIDFAGSILDENQTTFRLFRNKPIMIFCKREFLNGIGPDYNWEFRPDIGYYIQAFQKKVRNRRALENLANIGLILSGIAVGAGTILFLPDREACM